MPERAPWTPSGGIALTHHSKKGIPQILMLEKASDIIRGGGVVIVPTETFYALAADPFQEEAVRAIFTVKVRDEEKPLALIAADRDAVESIFGSPDPPVRKLMDSFWPGSLTILLLPLHPMSRLLSGSAGKIGVRIPPPCPARTLAELAGGWITATSANLSGDPDPDDMSKIASQVITAVDLVVDLGPTPGGKPSTVVELVGLTLRIVREGAIPAAALNEFARREF